MMSSSCSRTASGSRGARRLLGAGLCAAALLLPGCTGSLGAPWEGGEVFALRSEPETTASALAFVEPKVLLRVSYCSGGWCSVSAKGAIGHIKQVNLWGVYPHEVIDDRSIF